MEIYQDGFIIREYDPVVLRFYDWEGNPVAQMDFPATFLMIRGKIDFAAVPAQIANPEALDNPRFPVRPGQLENHFGFSAFYGKSHDFRGHLIIPEQSISGIGIAPVHYGFAHRSGILWRRRSTGKNTYPALTTIKAPGKVLIWMKQLCI